MEYIYNFFTALGVITYGCIMGYSVGIYSSSMIRSKDVPTPYEQKYYYEYRFLEDRDLSENVLQKLKNTYIKEKTPVTEVIMSYDHNLEMFLYWSDTKSIPYKYLDAVSHKYCIENDCKQISVDYKEEFDKATRIFYEKKQKEKERENTINTENNKPKSVFATFKPYNVKNSKKRQNDNFINVEKCNKFKHMGNILEYNETINVTKPPKRKIKNYINYSDFINSNKE